MVKAHPVGTEMTFEIQPIHPQEEQAHTAPAGASEGDGANDTSMYFMPQVTFVSFLLHQLFILGSRLDE
jgi:hypothetical protein